MSRESFLVLTSRHNLHPLANRLLVEGAKVTLVVERPRYHSAWKGRLTPVPSPARDDAPAWRKILDDLGGDPVCIEDSTHLVRALGRATGGCRRGYYTPQPPHPPAHSSMVSLGFWWDGEAPRAAHVLIEDRGAWAGAMGPGVVGAVTLVRLPTLPPALVPHLAPSTRGLVQVPVHIPEGGKVEPLPWRSGWYAPYWHAFLAALGDRPLAPILARTAHPELAHRFSVALPLSLPPWPLASGTTSCNYPVPTPVVEGLVEEDYGRVLWHDVVVTEGGLKGAGIDGLLGIVKGRGATLAEALGEAVEVAARVSVPEKSFRWDAGRLVPYAMVALQTAGVELHEDSDLAVVTETSTTPDIAHSEVSPRSDGPALAGDTGSASGRGGGETHDHSPRNPDGDPATPG